MPCRDGGPPDNDYDNKWHSSGKSHKQRADEAAKAACDLNKVLKHLSNYLEMKSYLPEDTIIWIDAHEKADRVREAAELAKTTKQLIRQSALNKLTPEEKAALGIK